MIKIFSFLYLATHLTHLTASSDPNFICPNDGLFKDIKNCQNYYECVWIGTPFEKQKNLECPIDLIYNPRSHRCDKIEIFEKQFENGVITSEDLLEFMRFRNCLSEASLVKSERFRLKNSNKMKENIRTVNNFLKENIDTLAKARFKFQKNKKEKDDFGNRRKILKDARMIKVNLNKTEEASMNTTDLSMKTALRMTNDKSKVKLNTTETKSNITIGVVHRQFMINNTEKSLLDKFLKRSGMKHVADFHFKNRLELISSLKSLIDQRKKINVTTRLNDTTDDSNILNDTSAFQILPGNQSAKLENEIMPKSQNLFKSRKLLAVKEEVEDEEDVNGTTIESGEFDVTDQSYQSRDQAVNKVAEKIKINFFNWECRASSTTEVAYVYQLKSFKILIIY